MKFNLKPLTEQVIVITGASSGIGLCTAKMAASRGARVVLTARSEEELSRAVQEIRNAGGQASSVVADVTRMEDMQRVADYAVQTFGGIDTWVNNAGIAAYGTLQQIDLADMQRVMDVTFWGVVHGSRAAIPHLKARGGALINVGSEVSDLSMPLIGIYSAAKHAVKAFTDVLRMELEKENAAIAVTLIKPGSIDTPFFEHAANYMETDPKPPPPVYAPDLVAKTIIEAAARPLREVFVGGAAKLQTTMASLAPRLNERLAEAAMFDAQKSKRLTRPREGSLYRPTSAGRERGRYGGMVRETSLYSTILLHPVGTLVMGVAVGVGLAGYGVTQRRRSSRARALPF